MAQAVAVPPTHIKFLDLRTITNWFQSMRAPASTVAPPVTSTAPGIAGQLAYDQNFKYVCVQTTNPTTGKGLWKRIPLQNF